MGDMLLPDEPLTCEDHMISGKYAQMAQLSGVLLQTIKFIGVYKRQSSMWAIK